MMHRTDQGLQRWWGLAVSTAVLFMPVYSARAQATASPATASGMPQPDSSTAIADKQLSGDLGEPSPQVETESKVQSPAVAGLPEATLQGIAAGPSMRSSRDGWALTPVDPGKSQLITGAVLTIGGVFGLTMAAALTYSFIGNQQTADAYCGGGATCDEPLGSQARDRAATMRALAVVSSVAGTALLTVGIVLIVTRPSERARALRTGSLGVIRF